VDQIVSVRLGESVAIRSTVRGPAIAIDIVVRMRTISVTVVDEDPGEADRLSRQLRTELLRLDIHSVELVLDPTVPRGAKADAGTVSTIVVTLASSPVLVQLAGALRDWINRGRHRKVVVREGDRLLELTGATDQDNRAAIDGFFNAGNEG
jgi:hypothetical protein